MALATSTISGIEPDRREGPRASQGTRQRILVVDDDPVVLESLRRLFAGIEADVETCADPLEAVGLFENASYDVVISDERMPHLSGLDVLRKVRACSPRTPTILMTAYLDPKSCAQAYELLGVYRYLTKPWDTRELLHTVKDALRVADALA